MAYQAYVLCLFLLILSAPTVFAYISYRRELKGKEPPPDALPEPPAVTIRPDRNRQRAEEVAAIVRDAKDRFEEKP